MEAGSCCVLTSLAAGTFFAAALTIGTVSAVGTVSTTGAAFAVLSALTALIVSVSVALAASIALAVASIALAALVVSIALAVLVAVAVGTALVAVVAGTAFVAFASELDRDALNMEDRDLNHFVFHQNRYEAVVSFQDEAVEFLRTAAVDLNPLMAALLQHGTKAIGRVIARVAGVVSTAAGSADALNMCAMNIDDAFARLHDDMIALNGQQLADYRIRSAAVDFYF